MKSGFVCPVYKKCGGCQLDVNYPEQLSYKQRRVRELLGRFCKPDPIIGMDDPLHYRCKASSAFGYSRGKPISGIWQSSSGKLTPVEQCALEDQKTAPIVSAIRELLPVYRIRTYNEVDSTGFLRFVTVRVGKSTGEILVTLGTAPGNFPGEKAFIRDLLKKRPEITTVVRNVSTRGPNLIPGKPETVLYGPGYITDNLCGYDFRISSRSFFQVNPAQARILYSTAVDLAGLDGNQTVIDAYCGVGAIGIIASGNAKSVLCTELNGDAVKNARENVRINGIDNVRIAEEDAGRFMAQLAEKNEYADVVFTDPPRAGCSRQFLSSLVRLAPEKVVYVSCDPGTLARDMKNFGSRGYFPKMGTAVDMFPRTSHVETVALLVKK